MLSVLLFRVTTYFSLMTVLPTSYSTQFVQTIYRKLDQGNAVDTTLKELKGIQSLTACAVACQAVNGCSGVEFESQTRTCFLHSWLIIKYPVVDARDVWIASDAKLFLVSRQDGAQMSYNDAIDLCSSLGARLPDPQEMYDAFFAGFSLCKCGWTYGNIIRVVLTQADPNCDNTNGDTGVLTCRWKTTAADTFCKFA